MKHSYAPLPSKTSVDRAGNILKHDDPKSKDYRDALDVANQWRTAHIYPINTFQARLRKTLHIFKGAFVAQRLKRMPTIIDKLNRHETMQLSTMQDIGGVRAVVQSADDVFKLVELYKNSKRFSHILKQEKDYITSPKYDGYRGVHLVYRYNNTLARTAEANLCKGLMVEVQIRSKEQHIWATSVEAIGMILDQSFKTNKGNKEWREFFEYVSSAFAIVEETPVLKVHEKLAPIDIYKEIKKRAESLQVFAILSGYTNAVRIIDEKTSPNFFYHLISLSIEDKVVSISIKGYSKDNFKKAMVDYVSEEKNISQAKDVVLVSAGQLRQLKKAYPNYFLDINEFQARIKVIIEELSRT